jgi:glycerol kinase
MRGIIAGLTRSSGRGVIARAALEAIAQQAADLTDAIADDLGGPLRMLRIDGGVARSAVLPQLIADLAGVEVQRSLDPEATARGAAMVAALGAGLLSRADLPGFVAAGESFVPSLDAEERLRQRQSWRQVVSQAKGIDP